MTIRALNPGEEPALIAFAGARNVPGAQLCLHLTDRPEEVAADFDGLDRPLVERALVRGDAGALTGAITWELGGPDANRCWLLGPWVEPADDQEAMRSLIAAVLDRCPPSITRIDNFIDAAHPRALAAHDALGFARRVTVHVLRAGADEVKAADPIAPPDGVRIVTATAEHAEALVALHAAEFPDTHTSVEQMLARAADRVLVALGDTGPVGYVHLHRPDALPEGRVEYIAVDRTMRARGVGRALLSAGLKWLVGGGVPEVFLTVHADNDRALGVYFAAGFAPYQTGIALTLRRPTSGA